MEKIVSLESSIIEEAQEGKHLIFQLDGRDYGIPILTVNEIIGIMPITPIPKAPNFVKGIINLRGKIVPIMDLRLKFGMVEKEHTEQTCIIIVNTFLKESTKQVGVVVDIVSEVVDIPLSEIEPAPQYSNECGQDFIKGVGKVKDQVVMLLNIGKVIYSDEMNDLLVVKSES